ncbi:hypothetical protein VNO78_23071 [Psophocarpus tetragonolobus]|uniref:N-acetyltransferase domain-containing protein n=1 Tax=Psophocarpus tetragonolobus TaxID=3891 RepID=A0AAN9XD96_PSOTE
MPSVSSTIHAPLFRARYTIAASLSMSVDSDFLKMKKKEVAVQLSNLTPPVSRVETVRFCDLNFGRMQPSDQELDPHYRFEFGNFVAREAMLDEEYWATAWLRTETEWENRTDKRNSEYTDNCKMEFADKEYNAIKERCKDQQGSKISTCIIAVRKQQKNVKRSVIKSVVGTLDLNIRYLLLGETFPGELVDAPGFCKINRTPLSRYGYIGNLCVAKYIRRKGIASNMLYFALESAKSSGVARVYAHVKRNNKPAQTMFQNLGFEVIQMFVHPNFPCSTSMDYSALHEDDNSDNFLALDTFFR